MIDKKDMLTPSNGAMNQFPAISTRSRGTELSFVHAWPSIFNIGDYLSSPRHYFDFECNAPSESGFSRILILGGGAFNDFGVYATLSVESDKKIAWGIGRSIQTPNNFELTPSIPTDFSVFGSRDRALVAAGSAFVPCASVMGGIVDIPPGGALGIFLNHNPAVSGQAVWDVLSTVYPGAIIGTNSLSETEFRAKFALTGKIVTNSYHIAYWGLLSGRQVALIGYSSKFTSLFDLFELPHVIHQYQRGDGTGLRGAIESVLDDRLFSCLSSPTQTKLAFRQINIDYAQHLVAAGFFRQIRTVDDSSVFQTRREIEIWQAYSLARHTVKHSTW